MKVYIVGAIPERHWADRMGWNDEEMPAYDDESAFELKKKEFGAACAAIAAALARAGHTIYVDIPQWQRLINKTTAVSYVIEGATQEQAKSRRFRIVLFRPKDMELPDPQTEGVADTLDELEALAVKASVDMKIRILDDDSGFFAVMREVDVFILLGGGPGTALTAQTANYFNRPVVALPTFGGAAEASFNLILSSVYQDMQMDGAEVSALARKWSIEDTDEKKDKNKKLADQIVRFAIKLRQVNMYPRIPNQRTLYSFPFLIIACIVLWTLAAATLPASSNVLLSYITALLVTSIMGSALRLMAESRRKSAITMTYTYILREMGMGFVVSFGLMLLYVVGGITFTASPIDLTGTGVPAIAFAISVLGLAGGFVMPIARLRTQLNDISGGKEVEAEASSE